MRWGGVALPRAVGEGAMMLGGTRGGSVRPRCRGAGANYGRRLELALVNVPVNVVPKSPALRETRPLM